MLSLKTNRLRVEIAEPGEAPNTTTRFDRAGFITEVVLDGAHRFCATEPNNLSHPSSGGRGLCCEYIFDVSGEAAAGEKFPKLGVGLLTKKSDAPYRFSEKYEAEPFHVGTETGEARAVFTTAAADCLGYAAAQRKTVALKENEITVSVDLKNTGRLPIEGREYCHNFLTLNGMAVGPDYRIDFENVRDTELTAEDGMLSFSGKRLVLSDYQHGAAILYFPKENIIQPDVQHHALQPGAFRWSMSNAAAGTRVTVIDEICIDGLTIWAADHMISVESFHKLSLKPGESSRWSRTWRFEDIR